MGKARAPDLASGAQIIALALLLTSSLRLTKSGTAWTCLLIGSRRGQELSLRRPLVLNLCNDDSLPHAFSTKLMIFKEENSPSWQG